MGAAGGAAGSVPAGGSALMQMPVPQIATDLRINKSYLPRWMAVNDVDSGREEGANIDERRELVELRRRNRMHETEVEILKRPPNIGFRLVHELAATALTPW